MARRRSARGKDQSALIALGLVLILLIVIVREIAAHLVVFLLLLVPVAGAVTAALVIRSKRRRAAFEIQAARSMEISQYSRMNPKQFEQALAFLCERDGCRNVKVVGGAGDLGADVLATTPDGRKLMIQAKRYGPNSSVNSGDVQKVNGTYRDIHHAHLAAIVTTSKFTKPALMTARDLRIAAFDEAALAGWASRTGPAPWH